MSRLTRDRTAEPVSRDQLPNLSRETKFLIHTYTYMHTIKLLLLWLFLAFSALVASPKKTTLHGGQSRSWSAEQGKKEKEKVSQRPPRARCSFGENKKIKNKNHAAHPHVQALRKSASRRWSRSVSRPYKDSYDSSARSMGVASQNSTLPCAIQLSQSRCLSLLLAMSGRVFLFFPPRGHEPPPTLRDRLNPHLSL